jgi:hypothetical protein
MNSVLVIPKEKITTRVVASLEINVQNVVLHVSAQIQVREKDSDGRLIGVQSVRIEGGEYENWASDDNYIVNLICNKLGYQLAFLSK